MTTSTVASDFVWQESASLDVEQPQGAAGTFPQFVFPATNLDASGDANLLSSTLEMSRQARETRMPVSSAAPPVVTGLAQYLAPFASHFKRSEGRQSLERHLTGLLSNIKRKNEEQIAHAVPGTNSQRLQALLTELQWDIGAVNEQRVQRLIREATTKGGILVCGETEMQKQGASSVGVARQYVETLGKIKNCQLILSCQYIDAAFSWPVNAKLYLPYEWTRDAARCQRARIPEESRTLLSKAELVLNMLDEAVRWGVPYRGIATTAAYGRESSFLAGLEKRGATYLVAVPEEFEVQVARRKSPTIESAQTVLSKLADDAWQPISWPRSTGYGSRGLWARAMCWRMTPEGQGSFGWLVGERPLNGRAGATRYYFANATMQTSLSSLARMAKRTTRLEEFYRFAKHDLGWSHYEGRLWHGFHRHTLLIFLAYSFLLLQRSRQGGRME
jgi:SRSO17 transposase